MDENSSQNNPYQPPQPTVTPSDAGAGQFQPGYNQAPTTPNQGFQPNYNQAPLDPNQALQQGYVQDPAQAQFQQPVPQQNPYQQNVPPENNEWLDQFQPPPQEEVVLTWNAPNRPFRPRNRKYYTTIAAIVILVSLILAFAGQFLPIAVVVSVGFLAYVLSAVPPTQVEFKLSSYGIRIDNTLYAWESMGRYWYEDVSGHKVLYVETIQFPYRLTVVITPEVEADLDEIMSQILPQDRPPLTNFEKAAKWLQEKFPLD